MVTKSKAVNLEGAYYRTIYAGYYIKLLKPHQIYNKKLSSNHLVVANKIENLLQVLYKLKVEIDRQFHQDINKALNIAY
jgi:hypothetical protein